MQVSCGSITEKGKWCEDEHDPKSVDRALERNNPLKEGESVIDILNTEGSAPTLFIGLGTACDTRIRVFSDCTFE